MITEYGCDAYYENKGPNETAQAEYHLNALRDIVLNQAAGNRVGNSIGGCIFEYLDEWWKNTSSPDLRGLRHETESTWAAPFFDGRGHEEWFGIVSQGTGKHSPFERQLRKAFYLYKKYWGTYKKNLM
ncbi:MAG: hypothetical protein AB1765_13365 [Candidatus Hydrogenedentota bacterium]